MLSIALKAADVGFRIYVCLNLKKATCASAIQTTKLRNKPEIYEHFPINILLIQNVSSVFR